MRRRFSDRWFLVAATCVLVAVAGGSVYFLRRTAEPPKAGPPPAAPAPLPEGAEVSFTGVVQARSTTVVSVPVEGVLEAMEVEVGQEVFEGQLLARIKNTGLETTRELAQMELERAQNRVNNLESALIAARLEASRASADASRARAEFEKAEKAALRQQMLYREGATARLTFEKAQREHDTTKAEFEALRELDRQSRERTEALLRDLDTARKALEERSASLEEARVELQAAEIVSPVDGVLVASRAKTGDEVNPAMPELFQIAVDLGQLQVTIEPDPKIAPRLRDGLPGLVQVLEVSEDGLDAELRLEESKFVVEFNSPNPGIRPGMNAIVKIRLP